MQQITVNGKTPDNSKHIASYKGPFTRDNLIELQNKINKMFNESRSATYLVSLQKGKIHSTSWCDFPKRNPEKIDFIHIFEYEQTPILVEY